MIANEKIALFQKKRMEADPSAKNYLFLDNNGVLYAPGKDVSKFMKRVEALVHKYDMKIVVTSSDRYDLKAFSEYMYNYGFDQQIKIEYRTKEDGQERDAQIIDWLLVHPAKVILILDDQPMDQILADYSVQTSFWSGFTEYAYKKAEMVIERQLSQAL